MRNVLKLFILLSVPVWAQTPVHILDPNAYTALGAPSSAANCTGTISGQSGQSPIPIINLPITITNGTVDIWLLPSISGLVYTVNNLNCTSGTTRWQAPALTWNVPVPNPTTLTVTAATTPSSSGSTWQTVLTIQGSLAPWAVSENGYLSSTDNPQWVGGYKVTAVGSTTITVTAATTPPSQSTNPPPLIATPTDAWTGLGAFVASGPLTLADVMPVNYTPMAGTSVTMGRDITGQSNAAIVTGLQGNPVSPVSPTTGQGLVWNGVAWLPSSQGASTAMGGDVSGVTNAATVVAIQGNPVSSGPPPSSGQIYIWSGSSWTPGQLQFSNLGGMASLAQGSNGTNMSITGPGFLQQNVVGGPVTVTPITPTQIATILGYVPLTNARAVNTSSPLSGGGGLASDLNLSCPTCISSSTSLGADLSGSLPNATVARLNGTTVPTNSAADQVLQTTASAAGAWKSVPGCEDTGGNHLNYSVTTHTWSCGNTGGTAGSVGFSGVGSGTNANALVTSGSIDVTGGGYINATRIMGASVSGISGLVLFTSGVPSAATSGDVITALGYTPENTVHKGAANGYAGLDGSQLLLTSNLPNIPIGNIPTIPFNHTSGVQATITGAPSTWPAFATVATSGAYSDLSGTPLLPSGTIVGTTDAQTLTNKSIDASEVNSGTLGTARMPALTGDATTSAGTVAVTVSRLNGTSLAGLATGLLVNTTGTGVPSTVAAPSGTVVGTTDTQTLTNKSIAASEVNSGTLGAARMPALTGDATTSVGTVAVTVSKLNGTSLAGLATGILINTTGTGVPSVVAAPAGTVVGTTDTQTLTNKSIAASEVNSGTLAAAQMPALTGDVTTSAGSVATTVTKINGTSLAGLATGLLKNTTATGVPSIAGPSDVTTALGYTPENVANKNTPNGYAPLDASSYLPLANLNPWVVVTDGSGNASIGGTFTVGTGSTAPGCISFGDTSDVHDVNLCAPSSGYNGTVTLWSSAGTNGQVNTVDGSGNMSWSNLSAVAGTLAAAQFPSQFAMSSGFNLTWAPSVATSGSPTLLTLTGPAHTGLANAGYQDVNFALTRTVQFTGGNGSTSFTPNGVVIGVPTYTVASTPQTLAAPTTLVIAGEPKCSGSGLTCQTPKGVWIKGTSVLAASATVATSYALEVDTPTGATANWAAFFNGPVCVGPTCPSVAALVNNTFSVYDGTASTGSTLAVMRAGAGQSTNPILAIQNNAGTNVAFVDSTGNISSSGTVASTQSNSAGLTIYNATPTTGVTTSAFRAGAGQSTSAIVAIQNNGGSNVAFVDSSGNITASGTITSNQNNSAGLTVYDSTVTTGNTTVALRAGAGQSTNAVLAVQNNSGSAVFTVDSSGNIVNGGTANATKLNGTSLAGLATGLLKNTTGTGVPSIAVAADIYGLFSGSHDSSHCTAGDGTMQTCGSGSQTWPAAAGIMVYAGSNAFGTSLTAPAGAIVGTTDTQTLTNKSIVATQLTGTIAAARMPALTGDVTTSAGTVATTVVALNGTNLAGLSTGILINTTGTGVPSVVAAPSGTVVGTTDTQTLTNKSIAASEVNSGTLAAAQMPALTGDATTSAGAVAVTVSKLNGTSLAGLATGLLVNTTGTGVPSTVAAPAGTVVGTTDTQTLSNKTLTSPSLGAGASPVTETWTVGTGGVTANTLVQVDTSAPLKIVTSTADVYGIAQATVSATGTVEVARAGTANCVTDTGGSTAGNLAVIGTGTVKDCKDSLQTSPANIPITSRIIGVFRSSVSAGASALVELTPAHYGEQTLAITGDVSISAGGTSATVTALNGTSLGGLATGLLKNTTTTGVPSVVAAPSGAVVGTTDTQTLTNKSIAASEVNSGTLAAAQMPALTGDVTTSAGAVATTVVALNGTNLAGLATGIMKITTSTGVPSSVAAPTGAIVGDTDTQTLTNKSIVASQLTGTIATARLPNTTQMSQFTGSAGGNTVAINTTSYFAPGGITSATTEATRQWPVVQGGTLKGLYIRTANSQPSNNSMIITVRTCTPTSPPTTVCTGSNTNITLTIAASAAAGLYSDTTHTATVSAGDMISLSFFNQDTGNVSAQVVGYALGIFPN